MTAPSRYQARFESLRQKGQKAFIPFTVLGWPNAESSFDIIRTMIESGASALELGLAFSDPVSDGPIIQAAATETLAQGFKVKDAFTLIQKVRVLDGEIPIGLMLYYNMLLARGIETFFAEMAELGVDGLLVVDLPPETAGEVSRIATRHGIDLIFIVSPLTSTERLKAIDAYAGGFLYIVSRLGITGTEERYDTELQSLIEKVKQNSRLPVCVGFGISNPENAQKMYALGADGVVMGSRIIQVFQQGSDLRHKLSTLSTCLTSMVLAAQTPDTAYSL